MCRRLSQTVRQCVWVGGDRKNFVFRSLKAPAPSPFCWFVSFCFVLFCFVLFCLVVVVRRGLAAMGLELLRRGLAAMRWVWSC